ncbi:diacylglycerol kinase 4-like protein [Tanacetum coccineum]|uniref:Diacylglycerol kinase 4-like protein n=1 Tax=Tanacetum coccineum TaxID=301880 RepID=A0ABQ5AYV2_9ASTR
MGGNHIHVDIACPPRKKLKGENALLYDSKRTVFIGNFPFDVKDEGLYQLFSSFNNLKDCIEAIRVMRPECGKLVALNISTSIDFLQLWNLVFSMPAGEDLDTPYSLKRSEEVVLDQELKVDGPLPDKVSCCQGVFYNYFSIGMDAQVAYGFYHLRNNKPYLAQGPISNKLIYSSFTCKQGWIFTPCMTNPGLRGLNNILRLHVKRLNSTEREPVTIPSSVRSRVALNLHSYASRRNPWGNLKPEYLEKNAFVEARADDGVLEVFWFKHGWHASFVMVELISAKHIAQIKMDPHTSLGCLCMGEQHGISLNDRFESEGQWEGPEYEDTSDSGKKKETKAFTFYQMETKEVSERYITPCFVSGLHAYDGETNLEYEKNMISNEFVVKLCLDYEEKEGEKVVKMKLLVSLKGELYFVKLIINPEEDNVEPSVIFGRSFLRITKGIVDFGNGILTIYPNLISFIDGSEDDLEAILASVNVSDIPPLDITDIPPFTMGVGADYRIRIINGAHLTVIFDEISSSGKESSQDRLRLSHIITMLDHSKAKPMGILKDVLCQVGVTTILAKFLILDIPVDRDVPIVIGRSFLYTYRSILKTIKGTTSTFDRVCHQKFYAAKVRNNHGESDSVDEEEYCLKREEMGNPFLCT